MMMTMCLILPTGEFSAALTPDGGPVTPLRCAGGRHVALVVPAGGADAGAPDEVAVGVPIGLDEADALARAPGEAPAVPGGDPLPMVAPPAHAVRTTRNAAADKAGVSRVRSRTTRFMIVL